MSYSEMEIKCAETIAITLKEVKKLNETVESNLAKGLLNADLDVRAKRDTFLNVLATLDYNLFNDCFPVMKENVSVSEEIKLIIDYGQEKGLLQYEVDFYGIDS